SSSLLLEIDAALLGTVKVGEESQLESAKICDVFTQRQFSVYVQIVHSDKAVILLHHAIGAFGELLAVRRGPPLFKIALAVKLASLIIKAVGQLMADDGSCSSVIHCAVPAVIEKGRLQ